MKKFNFLLLGSGFLPALLTAGEPSAGKAANLPPLPPAESSRSRFRISAGAGYRSIGDVRFDSGSHSGKIRLPFLAAAQSIRGPVPDSTESYADRAYLDGYVRQEAGTETDGSTWYWGYANASQVSSDAAGEQSLTFHRGAPSTSRSRENRQDRDPGSWGIDGDGAVPAVQLDWSYDLRPELSLGVFLQYSFLEFGGRQNFNNFNVVQTQTSHEANVTDVYSVGSIVIPLAPYEGTYSGPGPLINNRPTGRGVGKGAEIDRSKVQFYNVVEERLDVQLHQLSFGPTVSTRLGPLQLALGTGLSLNIANWQATHTETLMVSRNRSAAQVYRQWSDEAGGTDVLPGIYLQVAATLPLTRQFSLTAYGNHDWSQTLTGQVGPSSFTVDPSGWTLGGMIGFSF